MPIYEYKCLDCGKTLELLRSAADKSPVKCPACGSDNVTKLFSAFAGGSSESSSNCGSSSGFS